MTAYYGTAIKRPTGFGLPDFDQATFSAYAPVSNVKWCDEAGVPRAQCVHCQSEADDA